MDLLFCSILIHCIGSNLLFILVGFCLFFLLHRIYLSPLFDLKKKKTDFPEKWIYNYPKWKKKHLSYWYFNLKQLDTRSIYLSKRDEEALYRYLDEKTIVLQIDVYKKSNFNDESVEKSFTLSPISEMVVCFKKSVENRWEKYVRQCRHKAWDKKCVFDMGQQYYIKQPASLSYI